MGRIRLNIATSPLNCGLLALNLIVVSVGCLRDQSDSRAKGFGWDENLAPVDTTPNPNRPNLPPVLDKNFCQGRRPGTCFSLVLRIPKSDLVEDLGLSVLALGASSRNMRLKLDEACAAAWTDYRQRYVNDNIHRVRRNFVRSVEKMRCVYQFIGEESPAEDTALADNEMGLSARLTKFALSGTTTEASASFLGIKVQNKSVQTDFRSVSIFSGKELNPARGSWEASLGFGPKPLSTQSNLDRKIEWHWDREAILSNIQKIAADPAGSQASVTAFVDLAKSQLASASAATNPASASLILIGMGYNALRSVCGENNELCKIKSEQSDVTANVRQDLADLVPTSDTNELFRLSTIRAIQSVLDMIFVKHDPTQLQDSFQMN